MVVEASSAVIVRKKSTGVAMILLDCPGKQNFLTMEVMEELKVVLPELKRDQNIRAVAIVSGKPDTFVSGADLHEILNCSDATSAESMSRRGQAVLNQIAEMGKPVVAGIHGECLGGGLELALACDYRVATKNQRTRLGLPEVKLGLIPGLGGTQRLPRLIGLKPAIELMLSAEPITVQAAQELGLVDELVDSDDLLARTEQVAGELAAQGFEQEMERVSRQAKREAADGGAEKRKSLLAMMQRSIRIKTKGQYPAPMYAIEVMGEGLQQGQTAGLDAEARRFGELAAGEVCRNLVSIFFSTDFAVRSATAQVKRARQTPIAELAVVGAGMMGSGIAQIAAATGHGVKLKDTDTARVQQSIDKIEEKLSGQPDAGSLSVLADESSWSQVDLVLEAIFEDMQVKTGLFQELSEKVNDDCVLASNTSALSITQMAASVKGKERFLGLHFFHPVDRMPLVEVISHADTSRESLAKAMAFISKLGKVPIAVNDGPGFLVNRLLCCYLSEAARLAEQGTSLNWIEDAAVTFGMPMGPFALMDEVGLDIAFTVARIVHKSFGERLRTPALMDKMTDMKLLGKKSGDGFYSWDESDRKLGFNAELIAGANLIVSEQKPDESTKDKLAQQLVLPMVDEAARCLEEKIVRKPREIDLAMVLGIGFPAFRGGLLRWADSIGITQVRSKLQEIYAQPGPPRHVSDLILKLESDGRRFYSST